MIDLLADFVNIDSGSHERGVDAVGDRLQTWLEAAGILVRSFRTMFLAIAWRREFPASAAATGRSR
jgi:acetylornithine deacetylase/succinyl-diaminopimelate desuccinylase-like protein